MELSYLKYFSRQKIAIVALVLFSSLAVNTSANAAYVGYIMGDSFSNGASEWPFRLSTATIKSIGIGGQQLVQMEPKFADELDQYIADFNIDFAILQGGVNDVKDNVDSLSAMQAAVTSMASASISRDLPLLIVNIAPWTNAANQAKRDQIDSYNSWLDVTFAASSFVNVVDIYSLLVDPDNAQVMSPLYNLDGIHPNSAGHDVIAAAVDSAILSAVPVPAAVWLFGTGLAGLVTVARRKM